MGWSSQGYNAEGFNPALGYRSDYWCVECGGELDDKVEAFNAKSVDLGEWADKVRIVYGMSRQQFFRGYALTDNMTKAASLVRRFDDFLVYADKYGGIKAFHHQELTFLNFLDLVLFFETEPRRYVGDPISRQVVAEALLDELKFGIDHGFIDHQNKSINDIEQQLSTKIGMAK